MLSRIKSLNNIEFWCHDCDSAKVHSEKPRTGRFFCMFGTPLIYSPTLNGLKETDEYKQIAIAICNKCLKEEKNAFYKGLR